MIVLNEIIDTLHCYSEYCYVSFYDQKIFDLKIKTNGDAGALIQLVTARKFGS